MYSLQCKILTCWHAECPPVAKTVGSLASELIRSLLPLFMFLA
jgi:hypothetical protein